MLVTVRPSLVWATALVIFGVPVSRPATPNYPGDLVGSLIDTLPHDQVAYLRVAPIVVLAVVLSNDVVGPPVESSGVPGVVVVPHRVKCNLEEVLRIDDGKALTNEFDFVYFGLSDERAYNPYHRQLFRATAGERYLLLLIRQRNMIRSIGDVGNFTIPVYTGKHSTAAAAGLAATRIQRAQDSFGARISSLLLTIGSLPQPEDLARRLYQYRLISEGLGSRLQTFHLLRGLLTSEPDIRAAACFELNESFTGQSSCLKEIAADTRRDDGTRAKASTMFGRVQRLEQLRLGDLIDPAHLGFSPMMSPDSMSANYDELVILLGHPDARFRRSACAAIRRYYPRAPEVHHCAGQK